MPPLVGIISEFKKMVVVNKQKHLCQSWRCWSAVHSAGINGPVTWEGSLWRRKLLHC